MVQTLLLGILGLGVGVLGTLIGAGGGFILVPVLLMLYPEQSTEVITGISLAVVFFNALSGSVAYARMRRIDYKSGVIFALASIPGSVLGSLITPYIPRLYFNAIFGVLMIGISIFLFLRPEKRAEVDVKELHGAVIAIELTEKGGARYSYQFNVIWGIIFSMLIGFFSSIMGIGGGIIHVPVLTNLLNFPVHIATATSHFVLAVMAFSGSAVHVATGILNNEAGQIAALSVGVMIGAQFGARLSKKINGKWIIRFLSIALGIVGVRLLFMIMSI